jgi:PAS domain-containing protein
MVETTNMFDNLNVAIVASDADFKITYANDRCKKLFKEMLDSENFVGNDLGDCHQPETMEKIKILYQEFRERKKKLSYYTEDVPEGKLTLVSVPFYDGDDFAGAVEFIFESSLA